MLLDVIYSSRVRVVWQRPSAGTR